MTLSITPFSGDDATGQEVDELYDLAVTVFREDFPDRPVPNREEYEASLRKPMSLTGPRRLWTAREDGRLVGAAAVAYPASDARHVAATTIRVFPGDRRRGVGTSILRTILPAVRADGRTIVRGDSLRAGRSGDQWARALGFTTVQEFALQLLKIVDADRSRWQVPVPDGVRVERWIGAAPDDLVDSYAAVYAECVRAETPNAVPWTAEQVRQWESRIQARGGQNWVVAAVDQADRRVLALTEVETSSSWPSVAQQQGTAVATDARGRGLERVVRAESLRWLVEAAPALEQISEHSQTSDVEMIRLNEEFGFVVDEVVGIAEAEVETLLERVADTD